MRKASLQLNVMARIKKKLSNVFCYLNLKNEIVIKPEFTFSATFEDGKVILQKPDGEDYIVYKDGRVEKK